MYKDVITKAYKEGYAIPQFNFDDLEMARFILEECENLKSPVFLAVSEGAIDYMGGLSVVTYLVKGLMKDLKITVPVMLHLDHGKNIEICEEAIDYGFDSVMLDLSKKDLSMNIKKVKELVEYNENVIVECEIGAIGKNGNEDISYAKVEDCVKIMKETNAFMLAPAIGTVHGLYTGIQNVNIPLLIEINSKVKAPLVLHGGSDTKDTLIEECIKNGIMKVNINTNLKQAWVEGVRQAMNSDKQEIDYRKFIKNAEKYIKETIEEKILLFGSKDKA